MWHTRVLTCWCCSVLQFLKNSVCLAAAQRSPGPQGPAAREAKYVAEEGAGQMQVTVRTSI